jgi:hypothetical protein
MALIDRFSGFIKTPRFSKEEASKLYCEQGGIIRTEGDRLIFPGQDRLIDQLAELNLRIGGLTTQIRFWHRQSRGLAPKNFVDRALVATDPLFWQHLLKMGTEKDYRLSFETVELPIKYMREEKYRKIVHAFVNDKTYRKRLVKAKTSVISKGSIKEDAEKGKELKRKITDSKLGKLREERDKLLEKGAVLEALLEWSLGCKVEKERPAGGEEGDQLEESGDEENEERA